MSDCSTVVLKHFKSIYTFCMLIYWFSGIYLYVPGNQELSIQKTKYISCLTFPCQPLEFFTFKKLEKRQEIHPLNRFVVKFILHLCHPTWAGMFAVVLS